MPKPPINPTPDQCRACGRHVGLVGRVIDSLIGCRRRGCGKVAVAEQAPAVPVAKMGAEAAKVRLEGHPLAERPGTPS